VLPLGRSQCRRVDDVQLDLKEIGCKGMDWINLVQDMDEWLAVGKQ
jgi:hypothetical protein